MNSVTVTICGYDKLEEAGGPLVWLKRFPTVLREHGINLRVRLLTWEQPEEGVVLKSLQGQGFDVSSQKFSDTKSNIRYLLEDLANSPPDIYIPSMVVPAFYVGRWARSAGIPTIGVLHSDDKFYEAIQAEFVHGLPEYAVTAIVGVSKELAQQVVHKRPKRTLPVQIPYGVPIPDITATKIPGKLRIGFVGRLAEEQKRISEVTRAFCRVTRELDGVEATIYGDGPNKSNVEGIIAREGAFDRVKLAGHISSESIQDRLVSECDTIVLLSDYEGLPIALLEGMACGVVPVCLDIRSGIPELIQNGVTGLLVNDREESFIEAIRKLRDSQELWSLLSMAARKQARKAHSLDASAKLWVELFQGIRKPAASQSKIILPRRFNLPPTNPALASHDPRPVSTPLVARLNQSGRIFAGRIRRRLLGKMIP